MVLVDLSQVMISTMMVSLGNHRNAPVEEGMLRHLVLNTIRANRKKFASQYGEMIICADDKNYWRREVFPYYKAARKKARAESELNWKEIFDSLNKIRDELDDYFPYKVIRIPTAEADDIIGTIVHEEGRPLNSGEPILILSGDKDYIQLHKYGNVAQYDPTRKRWIKHSNPDQYLVDHILKGDTGDGIPNVLSPDNTFVLGKRQKPMTKTRLETLSEQSNMSEEIKRNWNRNSLLIDLSRVPSDIKEQVLDKYHEDVKPDRSHLMNYFIKNKLKHLLEYIGDF